MSWPDSFTFGGQRYEPSTPTLARYFQVPATGRFDQLNHDYQGEQPNNYKPRDSATQTEVPETINVKDPNNLEFLPLTLPVAEFYLATFRIANPYLTREEALLKYRELTRRSVAFTDKPPKPPSLYERLNALIGTWQGIGVDLKNRNNDREIQAGLDYLERAQELAEARDGK